jgi:hypothetical protein
MLPCHFLVTAVLHIRTEIGPLSTQIRATYDLRKTGVTLSDIGAIAHLARRANECGEIVRRFVQDRARLKFGVLCPETLAEVDKE